MAMENLTVITVLMGETIGFKKVRQCRRPYSNDAVMIPYRSKELGTGTIIIEREDLFKLKRANFKSQFNLVKFAVNVAKASYQDRSKPLELINEPKVTVHKVKDETVILRLQQKGFGKEDIIFSIKPVKFDNDGNYEWLQRVGEPEGDE